MQAFVTVFLYICFKLIQNQNTMKLKLLLVLLFTSSFLFASPSLSLVKSALYFDANGDGLINAGDTIIYTFTVTNTGDVALINLSVTDVMLNPSVIPVPNSNLFPTGTSTFSANYTITQSDIITGSVTNSATVSGTTTSGIPITDMSDSDNANLPNTNDPTVTQLQTTSHPAIGLIMLSTFAAGPSGISYSFSIKNKGDETLTDIYVSNLPSNSSFGTFPFLNIQNNQNSSFPLAHITSLAPGQEDTYTFTGSSFQPCSISNQAMVIATTSNGTKIIDLSDSNNYYSNIPTTPIYAPFINFSCDGIYQDANGNNVVDIGDVVNYTYQLNSFPDPSFINFILIDSNVVIANPNGNNQSFSTTGVHTIIQNDIDLGYVTNSPSINFTQSPCNILPFNIHFYDPSPCNNCPTPINCYNGGCIVTRISPVLPNLISGNVNFNINNDNCTTGIGYPNKLVTTTSGVNTYGTFTNNNGNYSLYIPNSGSFNTNALANLGSGLTSNPTSVTQVSSGENMNYPATFCISSATNVNDLSVVLIPIDHARPGFQSSYVLRYKNNGTSSLNGTVQLNYTNGKLSFSGSNYAQDATTANSLTYNFTELLPYQYRDIYINFNVLAPPTVNQGDILTFTTVGTITVTDVNTTDNTYVLNQSVVNSFDPNNKTVLEGATITAAQATRPLHYITRFQNTGTFAANTVVLKEILDADLNWNTFEPIGSSHNYRIQIKNGNQVTVTFGAINLINSSANEPASHGWFAYKIKPKSTFAVGNIASSNASIYFDYNLPIVTNTVNTQISTLANAPFDKNNFKIYPNPANTYFVIASNITESSTYELVDVNGKTLSSGAVENLKPIDISELASGFYFVNIKNQDSKQTYKIIKE
jgi:uncharacterized repeat protein (TIGR01451 family)